MWLPGRAPDKAGLGHVAGCTGGSGLEVPCCQGLRPVLNGAGGQLLKDLDKGGEIF